MQEIQVCNFADDTTLFVCNESLEIVLNHLEKNSDLAILWLKNNYINLNRDKCHLLVSGVKYEQMWAQIGIDKIWEERQAKLLGVTIDTELKFEVHISNLCNKGNLKLSVLSRLRKILTLEQRKVVFKSFFEAQFKYCPLIWMFCSRKINNKINKLHERALRLVYCNLVLKIYLKEIVPFVFIIKIFKH